MAGTAIAAGIAGALFLYLLELATGLHRKHPPLLWFLPLFGSLTAWMYRDLAGRAAEGTNLIIRELRNPSGSVPARMAPLILVSTLLAHFGGGSVGREGTAIQLGGGIGSGIARGLGLAPENGRLALLVGVAAGFGAVFGTPCAAAVFATECIRPGRIEWRYLPPCLAGAWLGHLVCLGCGGTHSTLSTPDVSGHDGGWFGMDARWLAGAAGIGLACGLLARLFVLTGSAVTKAFSRIPNPLFRAFIGGAIVVVLTSVAGTRAYLGLGMAPLDPADISITGAIAGQSPPLFAWAWKGIFTTVTLGSGFKGGEVTPLFFMGSTLGSSLSQHLHLPAGIGAAIGMMALFAGASRSPAACTVMGMELFGIAFGPPQAVACLCAFLAVGRTGIYEAQNEPEIPSMKDRQPGA